MLIWIILFFIVIIASFVMALKSMGDYQEQPLSTGLKYSLFLIQNSNELNQKILENIYNEALKKNATISLEKLFKGEKSALVIFAPKDIMGHFTAILNLLELEDYSLKEINNYKTFEIGRKDFTSKQLKDDFFIKLPILNSEEQLWWQIILKPKLVVRQCNEKNIYFQSIIRVIFLSEDKKKEQEIKESFSDIKKELETIVLPQFYTSAEVLKLYQQRILPFDYTKEFGEDVFPLLTLDQVFSLLSLKQG